MAFDNRLLTLATAQCPVSSHARILMIHVQFIVGYQETRLDMSDQVFIFEQAYSQWNKDVTVKVRQPFLYMPNYDVTEKVPSHTLSRSYR